MAITKISYTQVESLANDLGAVAGSVQSTLDEIKMLLNNIGNSDVWSGQAATEAKTNFDKLCSRFPEFATSIANNKTYLISAVGTYKSADTATKV